MEGDAIYFDGVGWIGQYYSYIDTFWDKGIAYFLCNVYFQELETLLETDSTSIDVKEAVERINRLNKRILEFEANREFFLKREQDALHGCNRG
tara:strand:+ start:107 stop:385 length:279 start_codon:yes stop_codon:yes gene_type:complete